MTRRPGAADSPRALVTGCNRRHSHGTTRSVAQLASEYLSGMSTGSLPGKADVGRRVPIILGSIVLGAWVVVLAGFDGQGVGVVGFVAVWTAMMVAMMLPSAAPFILLYLRGATPAATALLAAGYLAVWSVVGIAVWGLHEVAMGIPIPLVLALAGLYQLTPVKQACLRRYRSPADFLVERWRATHSSWAPTTGDGASAAAGH